MTRMGIKGWRKDKEGMCAKGNDEEVYSSGRGQSLQHHSGSGVWMKEVECGDKMAVRRNGDGHKWGD